MPSTIRNKIAQLREGKLTKSQKKLIDYFDNVDLRRVIYMSITDLAAATDVAEATVLRFCRSLGYNGYQEFRLNLAQGSTVLADEEPTDGRGTSYITEIANNYQTIYAAHEGAIAAPTAGLHFDRKLLNSLPHCFLTLHVGVGTFRPVKVDRVEEHHMHTESFYLPPSAADAINTAKRVIAVGTTSVRVLETQAARHGLPLQSGEGETDIFIYPGFQYQVTEALITNFHLPQSTLIMLVSAFAGRELILEAYRRAVEERYRFFSYGDCMLIL